MVDEEYVEIIEEAPDERPIGVAWMESDGSIVMQLRAEGPGGTVGDALITISTTDLRYREILKHLGAIKPGETVEVKPFP